MATALELLAEEASGCTRCPLAATRTQVVFARGDPNARLVFIGEAPGRDEESFHDSRCTALGRGTSYPSVSMRAMAER